eukprot:gene11513-13432_t
MTHRPIWCALALLLLLASVQVNAQDYCSILKDALMFYKAQRAGRLPDNDIPWRGNSVLSDASPGSSPNAYGDGDLSGGYFDAGDGVKFGLPMTYSMTMLGWAFIQYEANIAKCGLTNLFLEDIKWGTDWIIAAHTGPNEFVAQVGDGELDHSFWGPPEMMTMARPIFKINAGAPGTEVAMEAAAALSAASMIWKSRDPGYSATCLTHAKQLHSFGDTYRGVYSDSIPGVQTFYKSWSGFKDDIVWGTLWLYQATGDASLLAKAKADYADFGIGGMAQGNSHDWDLKAPGATILLAKITGESTYKMDAEKFLDWWCPGGGITYTPGGLAWIRQWGPARYAATSAFLASVYGGPKYQQFTQKQISYLLGNNPNGQSFVIGHGTKSPINPHHRASHHSLAFDINTPVNNVYLLTGALVGGPGEDDSYVDSRMDYVKNEVATDYNAGFVGALAALVDQNSIPVPVTTGTNPPQTTGTNPPQTTGTNPPMTTGTNPPMTTGTNPPTPGGGLTVFDDALNGQFQDWSWQAHNMAETSLTHSGSTSISFAPSAFGAVYFTCKTPGCITSNSLGFFIHGGTTGGQKIGVSLIKGGKAVGFKMVSDLIGGDIPRGAWIEINIPFSSLGVSGAIDGFWFQDQSGSTQGTVYLDDITLGGGGGGTGGGTTGTNPPQTTGTNPPQTTGTNPPNPGGGGQVIYDNQLAAGWEDWSWATHNLADSKGRTGTSISFKPDFFTGAFFYCSGCLDSSKQSGIELYANGGDKGNQKLTFTVITNSNGKTNQVGQPFTTEQIGGPLAANSWKRLFIDFSQLPAGKGTTIVLGVVSTTPLQGSGFTALPTANNYIQTLALDIRTGDTNVTLSLTNTAQETVPITLNFTCNPPTYSPISVMRQVFSAPRLIYIYLKGQPGSTYSSRFQNTTYTQCYNLSPVSQISPDSSYFYVYLEILFATVCDYSTSDVIVSVANAATGVELLSFSLMPPIPAVAPTTIIHSATNNIPSSPFPIYRDITAMTLLDLEKPNTLVCVGKSMTQIQVQGNKDRGVYLQANTISPSSVPTAIGLNISMARHMSTVSAPFIQTQADIPGYDGNVVVDPHLYIEPIYTVRFDVENIIPPLTKYTPNVIRNNRWTLSINNNQNYPIITLPSTFGLVAGNLATYKLWIPYFCSLNQSQSLLNLKVDYQDLYTSMPNIPRGSVVFHDTAAPWIESIQVVQIGHEENLVRIVAGDDNTGIYRILICNNIELTDRDLVSGTRNRGTYEKVITLVMTSGWDKLTITVVDLALNSFTTLSGNWLPLYPYPVPDFIFTRLSLDQVNNLRFAKYNVDVTNVQVSNSLMFGINGVTSDNGFRPVMRLAIPFVTRDDSIFQGGWNPSLQCFQINFTITQNIVEGNIPYILSHYISYDMLTAKFNQDAHLSVKCQNGDLMPPQISNVVAYPGITINVPIRNEYFGWHVTIVDRPNGFLRGSINVSGVYDPEPFTVTLDASNRISGDIYEGVYDVRIKLDTLNCRPQTYVLADAYLQDTGFIYSYAGSVPTITFDMSPYDTINYNQDIMQQMSIRVNAFCTIDETPPVITLLSYPSSIDVGASLPVMVTFTVVDPESGVSARHLPTVYLQAFGSLFSVQSESLGNNNYQANIRPPYGYGVPGSDQSMLLTVFGAVNNHLTIGGCLKNVTIERVFSRLPLIQSHSPIGYSGGSITLRGLSFGEVGNQEVFYQSPSNQQITPTFSSSQTIIVNMPAISHQYIMFVKVSGVSSNLFTIVPIPDAVQPTDPPIQCPGSPMCSNRGICTPTGCKCTSPYAGNDCSLQYIQVNSTIDDDSPNVVVVDQEQTMNSIISIVSLREVTSDKKVLHEYIFDKWLVGNHTTASRTIPYYDFLVNLDPDFSYLVGNDGSGSCDSKKKLTPGMIAASCDVITAPTTRPTTSPTSTPYPTASPTNSSTTYNPYPSNYTSTTGGSPSSTGYPSTTGYPTASPTTTSPTSTPYPTTGPTNSTSTNSTSYHTSTSAPVIGTSTTGGYPSTTGYPTASPTTTSPTSTPYPTPSPTNSTSTNSTSADSTSYHTSTSAPVIGTSTTGGYPSTTGYPTASPTTTSPTSTPYPTPSPTNSTSTNSTSYYTSTSAPVIGTSTTGGYPSTTGYPTPSPTSGYPTSTGYPTPTPVTPIDSHSTPYQVYIWARNFIPSNEAMKLFNNQVAGDMCLTLRTDTLIEWINILPGYAYTLSKHICAL